MEHEIHINGRLFEVVATGEASPEGFVEMFTHVINHEAWCTDCGLIVDFRELREFNTRTMGFKNISYVASFIKRNEPKFRGVKVVTLLRSTMNSKVVAGLLNALNEFYSTGMEHEMFTDHDEAVKWIEDPV